MSFLLFKTNVDCFRSSERGKSDPGGLSLDERASFGAQGSELREALTRDQRTYDGFQKKRVTTNTTSY